MKIIKSNQTIMNEIAKELKVKLSECEDGFELRTGLFGFGNIAIAIKGNKVYVENDEFFCIAKQIAELLEKKTKRKMTIII